MYIMYICVFCSFLAATVGVTPTTNTDDIESKERRIARLILPPDIVPYLFFHRTVTFTSVKDWRHPLIWIQCFYHFKSPGCRHHQSMYVDHL